MIPAVSPAEAGACPCRPFCRDRCPEQGTWQCRGAGRRAFEVVKGGAVWGAAGKHGACRHLFREQWAGHWWRGSSPKPQPGRFELQAGPDQATGAPLSSGRCLGGLCATANLHCWRPAGSNLPQGFAPLHQNFYLCVGTSYYPGE